MTGTTTVAAGWRAPGTSAPAGSITTIALALAEHARGHGMVVVRMLCSRVRNSATKHLQLRDAANRLWLVRVSDHLAPIGTGYDLPHFDLVSRDGTTGAEAGFCWLNQVARGEIVWSPPERSRQRRGHHVRGQKHKPGGCK